MDNDKPEITCALPPTPMAMVGGVTEHGASRLRKSQVGSVRKGIERENGRMKGLER